MRIRARNGTAWLMGSVALLAAAACSSSAKPPGEAPTSPPPAAPGETGCAGLEAPFSPLRRLTRREYDNTVRDLLGDDSSPADRFPPDEVSGGFGNNAAVLGVSPLLAEKYQEAAEALATRAVRDLGKLTGCDPAAIGDDACARRFVDGFGARAYRRPLAPAERDRLLAVYAAGRSGGSFAEGIEVVLRAILQSPSFLYRPEYGRAGRAGDRLVPLTGHEVATRLSYLLWGTMPDARLAGVAAADALATPAQVSAMARQMLADPRARAGVIEFHRQWLGLGALDALTKDGRAYPDFTPELVAAMRAESEDFVDNVVFSGAGSLRALLTSTRAWVAPSLARLYGVPAATGEVALPAAQRAGLLTQAGLLSVYALPDQSSPVHRGKMVREQVLCQPMPPQPAGLVVVPPEVDPRRPTRERFDQHAADPACGVCHHLMDPIGFGFEAYDGIGRFRERDGGRAIDARGELTGTDADGPFDGVPQLAERLASSAQVRDCAATQWFRFAFGRLEGDGDSCSLRALQAAFAAAGGDVRELLVSLTTTEAFRYRPALDAWNAGGLAAGVPSREVWNPPRVPTSMTEGGR